jgi:hypothetical protein
MKYSQVMFLAWKRANDFNQKYDIGSKVMHAGKEATLTAEAYVLAGGQVVVVLNDNQTPVNIENILVADKLTS